MINIKNIDNNECFQECLVRNLHPANCKPPQITNAYKDFEKENKFEESNSVCISGFGCEKKEKYSICSSKKHWEQKHVDLLLIKIRSLFIINPDFESILLPEGDEKKNLEKSYSSKHTCGYKQIYNFNKQI